jgi:8-oxo-dGTP diphosphatase
MTGKPSLTVDGVLVQNGGVLLVRRKYDPFRGAWALPGGFVEYGETVEQAVVREVREETGIAARIVRLAGVYSEPDRDPRGHTVSVVFLLAGDGEPHGASDAADARFFPLDDLPDLAFDHGRIIRDVCKATRSIP